MGEFKKKLKTITSREYTREEIINFLLYVTIILVPLIFTKTAYTFITGKLIALYLIGAVGLVFGIKELIAPFYLEKKITLIFLLSLLVASILSPYKVTAFLGSSVRGEGLIMYTIYIILFFLAIKYLKITNKGMNILFVIASIISIYGILQFYQIDPIQQAIFGQIYTEFGIISTIGNRNFLSNYICIFLFISSAMYIFKKEKKYLIFATIQFAGILCTLTRGGWLSFIVFAIVGLLYIIKRKDCLKRALVLFIIFTLIFGCLNITSNNQIIGRTDKELVLSEDGKLIGTAGGRTEILRICLIAFADSPLIGFGPDTLKNRLLDDYPNDAINYLINHEVYIDKAHNEYMEYAVSGGIFTLISYLVLIAVIIRGLIKNKSDDINKVLLLTLIGYLVQAFFNISTIAVAPVYWILLGYCVQRIRYKK